MKKLFSPNLIMLLVYAVLSLLPAVLLEFIFLSVKSGIPQDVRIKMGLGVGIVLISAFSGFIVLLVSMKLFERQKRKVIEIYRSIDAGNFKGQDSNKTTADEDEVSMVVGSITGKFHKLASSVYHTAGMVGHMLGTIKSTSDDIAKVAGKIADASEAVSEGSSQQAKDAEECLVFANNLIEKFETLSVLAYDMKKKSDHVDDMTESGKKSVKALIEKSKVSEEKIKEITRKVSDLNEMASNISQITEVISQISSQTNLLSLNAAIEAARAGEMGRGFAVVAGEIKKLADQSIDSSRRITHILNNIRTQVSTTMENIDITVDTIGSQMEAVYSTDQMFNGISDAVKDMNKQLELVEDGFGTIDASKRRLIDSITNIAAVAQESTASTQEVTSLMLSEANSGEILSQIAVAMEKHIIDLGNSIKGYQFDRTQQEETTYAIISCVDAPIFRDAFKSAEEAAHKLGIKMMCMAPAKPLDVKEQVAMIQKAVQQGVKGIGISPIGSPEVRDALREAIAKGIQVVCFDGDMSDIARKGFIGTDNVKAGRLVGEITARLLNGKGQVICAVPNQSQLNMSMRLKGFREVLQQHPGIQILGVESSGSSDIEVRWNNIKDMIQKNPGFDSLVCFDARSCQLAPRIRNEMKLSPTMIAFDKTPTSVELLESGHIHAIVAQRSGVWGELVVRRLNELVAGKRIPEYEDTGAFEINKNNLKVFKQ